MTQARLDASSSKVKKRAEELFQNNCDSGRLKTDRMFVYVLFLQFFVAVGLAIIVSPRTWAGTFSQAHLHVYAAFGIGGLATLFPFYLVLQYPGAWFNRYFIAIAQMFYSALLIHLTGGRIESHFHIFGSLAILAFYRDWKVIFVATAVTAIDHFARGLFWPESVYGILSAGPWRTIEHALWIAFEDIFILISIRRENESSKMLAVIQTSLEENYANVESLVLARTKELLEAQQQVMNQQQLIVASAKMSALGEMAGGVAHEINSPLAIISMRAQQMEERLNEGPVDSEDLRTTFTLIQSVVMRIAKIVSGLKTFAREGKDLPRRPAHIKTIIDDTMSLCAEKLRNNEINFEIITPTNYEFLLLECQEVLISQLLLNLISNAVDAVEILEEKWIRLEVRDLNETLEVSITDSGLGIPMRVQEKMMQPFFTTKEIGKGTGLGLSISSGIAVSHNTRLYVDNLSLNTRFVVNFPAFPLENLLLRAS